MSVADFVIAFVVITTWNGYLIYRMNKNDE